MDNIITTEKAMEITGLSQPTISKWAQIKNQKKIGRHMWILSPEFVEFLKTIKPRNRKTRE
jgi:hypothetical protein